MKISYPMLLSGVAAMALGAGPAMAGEATNAAAAIAVVPRAAMIDRVHAACRRRVRRNWAALFLSGRGWALRSAAWPLQPWWRVA